MNRDPNIVFIVIDALRARNLGCYGYSKQTSPNIDALAKNGVVFENAFSCAVTTDPSVTTIFSGKYPRSHGIMLHGEGLPKKDLERFETNENPLLPEILKSEGYRTLAADWLGRWHRRGYDYYTGISKQRRQVQMLHWLMIESLKRSRPLYSFMKRLWKPTMFIENAKIVTDKAIDLLRKVRNNKFFLFIHYWDTHQPYNPTAYRLDEFMAYDYNDNLTMREILSQIDAKHVPYVRDKVFSYLRLMDEGRMDDVATVNELFARYDAAIALVDHEIGRLMDFLDEQGILEQTSVVLTADHGESLTEHGIYFGHHGLYDTTIQVPLIFKFPEFPKDHRIQGLVQHTEIVPTILDALSIRKCGLKFDGKSTLPLISGDIAELRSMIYAEEADLERKMAIRSSQYKHIHALTEKDAKCGFCGQVHGGVEELYNLKHDPMETRNLIEEDSDRAKLLCTQLNEWVRLLEEKKTTRERSRTLNELSKIYEEEDEKEIMERLRKLGYV